MVKTNTASINIKVDKDLKANAEDIFDAVGLSMSAAITIYLKQVQRQRAIPFKVEADSRKEETLAAVEEANRILSGEIEAKRYSSADEMHRDLFEGNYL
jgi:DNA-damage-inducible protein J